MTETLGIHVSADGIAAAVGFDDAARPPITVMLGTAGPVAVAAVAAGPDGSVLVGDAAVDADGPVVTDPLDRAVRGRTGALTAVFTHVIGRAAFVATDGRSPTRLALVVPDDYDTVARDQVVAAANGAGITDVSLVPESLASARGRRGDGTALAVGAALIGAVDVPPPIVTREDLGEAVDPPDVAPSAPSAATGPVSVFDEEPPQQLPPAVREAPVPVDAQPERRSPVAPVPAPTSMVPPPPLQPIPPRQVPIGVIAVVVGVIAMMLVGVAVFGGGDDPVETAGTTTVAPATTATATSEASSTTLAPSTTVATTTEAPSTTSVTSTTSSTTSTSTTTVPVKVATPGPVTLVETGLQFDTGVVVRFGDSEEDVIGAIRAVLGAPDADSGRAANDFCDGTAVRFVRWGNLELVFTGDPGPIGENGSGEEGDEGDDPESPVPEPLELTQWFADGHRNPTGLVTPEGVGESATVGLLEVTYGSALQLVAAFEDDIVGVFAVTNPQTGAVLNGTTLGLDPDGVVTTLWAGDSCARLFT